MKQPVIETLPQKDCPVCGTVFAPRVETARYCSKRCKNRRPRRRADRRKTPSLGNRTCEVCGKAYGATYAKQRTCGRSCGGVLNMREQHPYKKTVIFTQMTIHLAQRQCIECGQDFVASDGAALCSKACGRIRWNRARRATYTPAVPTARPCMCGTPVTLPRRKCDTCIASTKRERKGRDRRRRRALRLGADSETYTLAEIAARDRRNCQLCGKRVAMTKQVPHPKAPVIDHVLPLARGGADTRANVQLAHFMCNSVKSAGGTQQLALIG